MERNKIWNIIGFGLLMAAVSACFDDDLNFEEIDIVSTNYKPEYFTATFPATYHMPDTIGLLGINPGDSSSLTREQIDFILDQVELNFSELGYERFDSIDTTDVANLPDVIIAVNALVVPTENGDCLPWWGWWENYPWYPGWGWGSGYCYPEYGYTYSIGTVMIDMISPVQGSIDNVNFNRVWEAGINGLLKTTQANNQTFIRDRVDKAFALSPYLRNGSE
jgi:hypothetical protein